MLIGEREEVKAIVIAEEKEEERGEEPQIKTPHQPTDPPTVSGVESEGGRPYLHKTAARSRRQSWPTPVIAMRRRRRRKRKKGEGGGGGGGGKRRRARSPPSKEDSYK